MQDLPNKVKLRKLFSTVVFRTRFLLPDACLLTRYCGGRIYLNLKESPMMVNRAFGVYEYWKTQLLLGIVKEGMTIIDVGVNKGYFSLLFAKQMNDQGKVLSFEPDVENCLWFRRSIRANGYNCIKLFQHALSDREGNVTFHRGKKSGWGSFYPSSQTQKETITVKTRKLDNVLSDKAISKVDLIKIDVQGADLQVLRGAEKTLRNNNVKLAMDIDVRTIQQRGEVLQFLKSCGFSIFRIGAELTPITKIDRNTSEIYAVKDDACMQNFGRRRVKI